MLRGQIIGLFVIIISGIVSAQDSIYGKIYGDNTIAKYIKVSNIIKNTTTFSDEDGNFSLKVSVGDSVIFSSSFYEEKEIVINNSHVSEILVIQLKEKINQLDEVVLKEDIQEKKFNSKIFQKELNILVKNDIKNKPWEYKPQPDQQYGVNLGGFIYLAKLLFPKNEKNNKRDRKDKNNEKQMSLRTISHFDLIKLNSNDEFFSDMFITKDLKIPMDSKNVFFAYFE